MLQPATLLKITLIHRCFSHFLNCTNGTKSRNASHLDALEERVSLPLDKFGMVGRKYHSFKLPVQNTWPKALEK